MEEPLPTGCRVKAWCPAVDGILEVFHARIVDYAYPAHAHDTWTVLIVDSGAICYDLDRRRSEAETQTVAILPPGVVHNGRPAPGSPGFTKRVLYLDEGFLPPGLVGTAVDKTTLGDPTLRWRLAKLHQALLAGDGPLGAESRLAQIRDRLLWHLGAAQGAPRAAEPAVARRLRDLLDEDPVRSVSLHEASAILSRSKSHLVRSFTATFGVSPHAYVIGRRVDTARAMLLAGVAPAQAAASAGFYDQAHLTRHFKRHTSVPPATYAASAL